MKFLLLWCTALSLLVLARAGWAQSDDAALKAKTVEFRQRLADGATPDQIEEARKISQ